MTRPICLQGTSGSGPKLFWTPATLASSKRLVYLVQMKRFSPNTIMVQFGGKTKLDFFLLFNPTLLVSLQIIFQNDHLSSSPPLPLQPSYNLFSPGPQQKPLSALLFMELLTKGPEWSGYKVSYISSLATKFLIITCKSNQTKFHAVRRRAVWHLICPATSLISSFSSLPAAPLCFSLRPATLYFFS